MVEDKVVPHAGTWIEISLQKIFAIIGFVVPHAGTWIEIGTIDYNIVRYPGRSPRGNVD